MQNGSQIPQSAIDAGKMNQEDHLLVEVKELETTISEREKELRYLKSDLDVLKVKRRKSLKISHRESAMWCIEVDQDNPDFFLKTSKGVATCVAIKNNLGEVDADLKSKTASALSWLFLNNEAGRIDHNDTRYYGVLKHFSLGKDGHYSVLKPSMIKKLDGLKEVILSK